MTKKILVVEDDPTCNQFLSYLLEDEGFDVRAAISADEAFSLAQSFEPDILIADWWLKDGMDGAEVADRLSAQHAGLKVIFATGSPSAQLSERLSSDSTAIILEKPIDLDRLIEIIRAS